MKQRLHTLALAALTSLPMLALNPPTYFIIDRDKALAGIYYPTSKSWYEDDDTETTEIKIPETYTDANGVVYTVIAMEGGFPFYKNLQKVYVPKTIKHVGYSYTYLDMMNWQYFLEYVSEIEIDPANEYFTLENNIVFSKDKTTLFGAPLKNNQTSDIEIPEGVKYICGYAFRGLPITSVSLPNSVIAIGNSAFEYCRLTEVTLPDKLKYVGSRAFTSPLKGGSNTEFEYRVEIKNIPSTLIYDDLRWFNNTYNVCFDEEIYINPGNIHTNYISANPDAFPNLKSVRKDGMHGNTMAYTLVDFAQKYVAKGLNSPTIYANDSIIAACKNEIKRAKEGGNPFSAIPEMVSTGPMTPLIPGTDPENINNIEDIIITIDKSYLRIQGGSTTPLVLQAGSLRADKINADETDYYYPAIKLVESLEYPGKYHIRCSKDNVYMAEISPWNPQSASLNDCRPITFHDASPALFNIIDNGDGSYSITDSEGHSLCPGYDSYNILRGKSDFERYNSNYDLKTELSKVILEASALCETEGLFKDLIDAPEQLRSEHSEPREGSFANLFDDNVNTFWHSAWSITLDAPRHNLDMIFAEGQTARNIIVDYRQRPYIGSKLGNARFHWSIDGGETFSDEYIEFDNTNGLNDDAGQLELELDVDANALRLSGVGNNNRTYWAMGELRVRDANAKPIIEYSEEGRLELAKALAEVDRCPATGNFAESIAMLRALMESIKNGTYGGIETNVTERSEKAVEWYNLQGRRISHPTPGQIYIRRAGNMTTKVRL